MFNKILILRIFHFLISRLLPRNIVFKNIFYRIFFSQASLIFRAFKILKSQWRMYKYLLLTLYSLFMWKMLIFLEFLNHLLISLDYFNLWYCCLYRSCSRSFTLFNCLFRIIIFVLISYWRYRSIIIKVFLFSVL